MGHDNSGDTSSRESESRSSAAQSAASSAKSDNNHAGQEWLLTPGPLSTAESTRRAMLRDWGSWDQEFCQLTARLREELLVIAGAPVDAVADSDYDCVPIQGSGTFVVEAMLGSLVPKDARVLVLINGAYGTRITSTLNYLGRDTVILDKGDYLPPTPDEVDGLLSSDPEISHVVLVHCETSSGILNPVEAIAQVVARHSRKLLIDSMSAFGALPLDYNTVSYEALVSSANKCIEGVPGFGFVIARKQALQDAKGCSHSLSLDLHAQWDYMNRTGQWRFTPPTHTVAAFIEALNIHRQEGGQPGRLERYTTNRDVMVTGMRALGFETLLDNQWLSPIIVTFFNPKHANFEFTRFYNELKNRGFIIYPGKLTVVDSFRIGCIGRPDKDVMEQLVAAVADTLNVMGVDDATANENDLMERTKLLQSEALGSTPASA